MQHHHSVRVILVFVAAVVLLTSGQAQQDPAERSKPAILRIEIPRRSSDGATSVVPVSITVPGCADEEIYADNSLQGFHCGWKLSDKQWGAMVEYQNTFDQLFVKLGMESALDCREWYDKKADRSPLDGYSPATPSKVPAPLASYLFLLEGKPYSARTDFDGYVSVYGQTCIQLGKDLLSVTFHGRRVAQGDSLQYLWWALENVRSAAATSLDVKQPPVQLASMPPLPAYAHKKSATQIVAETKGEKATATGAQANATPKPPTVSASTTAPSQPTSVSNAYPRLIEKAMSNCRVVSNDPQVQRAIKLNCWAVGVFLPVQKNCASGDAGSCTEIAKDASKQKDFRVAAIYYQRACELGDSAACGKAADNRKKAGM